MRFRPFAYQSRSVATGRLLLLLVIGLSGVSDSLSAQPGAAVGLHAGARSEHPYALAGGAVRISGSGSEAVLVGRSGFDMFLALDGAFRFRIGAEVLVQVQTLPVQPYVGAGPFLFAQEFDVPDDLKPFAREREAGLGLTFTGGLLMLPNRRFQPFIELTYAAGYERGPSARLGCWFVLNRRSGS